MKSINRPNVIFVMLDTISADHLKLYGGNASMKNFENMAIRGTKYANAIAPGTYTLPSHLSMFLGKRVRNIKMLLKNPVKNQNTSTDPLFLKNKYIRDNDRTLAMQMSHLGYKTSLFSNNPFITESTGLSTGFSYIRNVFIENKLKYHKTTLRIIGNDFSRENLTKLAYGVSYLIPKENMDNMYLSLRRRLNRKVCNETGAYALDQGAELTNKIIGEYLERSFGNRHFMFVNYMEAHEGYPTNLIVDKEVSQDRWMYVSNIIDNSGINILKKAYEKRLQYLDSKLGELIKIMRTDGILDNAIVIMASDHGQAFGEHGQLYHNLFPYNEISKVPFVTARYLNGKQVKENLEIENPVGLKSLYNRILEIGYGKMMEIPGNETDSGYVFSDHTGMLDVWDMPLLQRLRHRSKNADLLYKTKLRYNTFASAIYKGRYKLIHYYGSKKNIKDEMYDLRNDPEEMNNIVGKNRDVALQMLSANKN